MAEMLTELVSLSETANYFCRIYITSDKEQ
jgi:hypothetical protein